MTDEQKQELKRMYRQMYAQKRQRERDDARDHAMIYHNYRVDLFARHAHRAHNKRRK